MNKRDLLNQTDVMQRRVTLDDLVGEMIGVDAPPAGLAVLDGGGLAVHGFTLTSTGLIAPETATFEDWQAVGDILRRLESGMQWLIGHWYRLGEHQWGSMYEDAAVMLGYSAKTLREYAYVSRNVELSIFPRTSHRKANTRRGVCTGFAMSSREHCTSPKMSYGKICTICGHSLIGWSRCYDGSVIAVG